MQSKGYISVDIWEFKSRENLKRDENVKQLLEKELSFQATSKARVTGAKIRGEKIFRYVLCDLKFARGYSTIFSISVLLQFSTLFMLGYMRKYAIEYSLLKHPPRMQA